MCCNKAAARDLMAEVLNDERLVCPEANYIVSRMAILSLTNILLCAYYLQLIDKVNLSQEEDLCCLNEEEAITKKACKFSISYYLRTIAYSCQPDL